MRLIIPELPYEQPLARGRWRYEQDGHATGQVEKWRLSAAHDGFFFLRVDLDARQAASGRSYLYHVLLDAQLQPARVQYRVWRGANEVIGNVHLEEDAVMFTSGQGDERLEEMINVPAGFKFWFPTSSALGLLARSSFAAGTTAVALVISENTVDGPTLMPLVTNVEKIGPVQEGDLERVHLFWENQQRTIWFDSSGWPARMQRQDGLTAVETQLITYQRISKPDEPQTSTQSSGE